MNLSNQDIILNIAVNMDRLSKWAYEGKPARIKRFLEDTDMYVEMLKKAALQEHFLPTYYRFLGVYEFLKLSEHYDEVWSDQAGTWANILTHRAKLA